MIRLMKPEDYEKVYSLWISCQGMGLNKLDDSREGIEKFLLRNPETCFVSEEDGIITGVILAGNDGRRGYIYHAAVHPDHRRLGIGGHLVDAVLAGMKCCGIHKIALVAFADNEVGNTFWEEQGFSAREDLVYRNRAITQMQRVDT